MNITKQDFEFWVFILLANIWAASGVGFSYINVVFWLGAAVLVLIKGWLSNGLQ